MNRKERRASQRRETAGRSWQRAQAHYRRGETLQEQGNLGEAETSYRRAIRLRPDYVYALNNLGNVLLDQDKLKDSEASYRRALKFAPHYATAHSNLGNVLRHQGRLEESEASTRHALELDPDYAIAHRHLGNALRDQNKLEDAMASYRRALKIKPDWAEVHVDLGNVLDDQGRSEKAEAHFRRAMKLTPDWSVPYNNLGNVLNKIHALDEAEANLRKALELEPGSAFAHNNLGNALSGQGRLEESEASFRRALDLEPDYPEAQSNLGGVLREQNKSEEAEAYCRQAVKLNPDFAGAHHNLALALLLQGKYREGWEEYEWRWQEDQLRSARRSFPVPMWDGSKLDGRTILLHAEQGFGDTIQFVRYASFVSSMGGNIVLECPHALTRILESVEKIGRVVAKGSELPPFDLHCPLLSLPRLHGTALETIPSNVPYITPEPQKVAEWAGRIEGPRLKAGIAWGGNPKQKNDRNRSLRAPHLQHIVDLNGPSFVSLQVGARTSDLETLSDPRAITDFAPLLTDFSETAAAIANLDLVITIDTAVAHLAGAMGKPVWVMQPFAPAWQWLMERDDSPWYPTMRLYRQQSPGDWQPVLDRIRADLVSLSVEHQSSGSSLNRRSA